MTADDVYRKLRSALIAARHEADEERVSATAYYEVFNEALRMQTNNVDIRLMKRYLKDQSTASLQALNIIRDAEAGESE